MTEFGTSAVILGRQELIEALGRLPGRVVQKIMDDWTMRQAKLMASLARKSAPRGNVRERNKRGKPESARLWRVIKASKVKSPQRKFRMISRAISYGAKQRAYPGIGVAGGKRRRKNANLANTKSGVVRARHFHLAVLGTRPRHNRNGRYTGAMWGKTPNPLFWQKAQARVMAVAGGEVGQQLRESYERGIQAEIRSLSRKYK